MLKNWLAQGIIANIVSAVLITGTGVAAGLLAKNLSAWAAPVLYGLGASALVSVIVMALRNLSPQQRRTIRPGNAKATVRECLDKAGVAVQNSPMDGWIFNYVVTVDGRKIAVGQQRTDPGYLHFSTGLTFTEEDNRVIEGSNGGSSGVVKALRIGLAAQRIAYSGIEAPFKQVTIKKQAFMGEGFGEYELMQIVLEVEAALTLADEIATIPHQQKAVQTSRSATL